MTDQPTAPPTRQGPGLISGLPLPRVIGHRGAAGRAPENTLAGLRQATRLGAGMAEVDVQLSRDGVAVLMHDDTVDRTTDGSGAVANLTASTLKALDAGAHFSMDFAGERIPTLAEALALCADLGLAVNLELKLTGEDTATRRAAARIAAAAATLWPADRPPPLLSSFSHAALLGAAEAVPDWPRGCLFVGLPDGWQTRADAVGAATLNVHRRNNPAGAHEAFLAFGLPVLAYTVNDSAEALDLFDKGFTAVFSDRPDRILQGLADRVHRQSREH